MSKQPPYGSGDTTYRCAGGEAGIRKLVDSFYDIMSQDPKYQRIWDWHPGDNEVSRDKLTRFLCAWMGGPRLFSKKYGAISIPSAHAHLGVTEVERDLWLGCMAEALAQQDYPDSLVEYLLKELAVPAERIRQVGQTNPG
jgi:hemoglobin